MRARRFTIPLDMGVLHEFHVIEFVESYPQGRRQQKIRELLVAGAAAIEEGHHSYDRIKLSGYDPLVQRVVAHLKDDAPDEPRFCAR
jgi:hypothetical protein